MIVGCAVAGAEVGEKSSPHNALHPVRGFEPKIGGVQQQFEVVVTRLMIGMMMPEGKSTLFGTDSASKYWKSLLLDGISDAMVKSGRIPLTPIRY